MTADQVIIQLTDAGLNPKAEYRDNRTVVTVTGVKTDRHPKPESVTIVVYDSGEVRSSKYAYLLPDGVNDDIRLADNL